MNDKQSKEGVVWGWLFIVMMMFALNFYPTTSLHFTWEKVKEIQADVKLIKRAVTSPCGGRHE